MYSFSWRGHLNVLEGSNESCSLYLKVVLNVLLDLSVNNNCD